MFPVVLIVAACGGGRGDPDAGGDDDGAPPGPDDPDAAPSPVDVVGHVELTGVGPPPAVIYQDGDGPWQIITADADGDYTFTVTTGRYGFGEVCVDNQVQELVVRFATVGDPPPRLVASCGGSATPITYVASNGTISGLIGGGYEGRSGPFLHASDTTELAATYHSRAIVGSNDYLFARKVPARDQVDRLEIVRDVVVEQEQGPVSYDIDIEHEGFATERRALTVPIDTDAGDGGYVLGAFSTAASGSVLMTEGETAPFALSLPPATVWRAGDRYLTYAQRSQGAAYQSSRRLFDTPGAIPDPFVVELPAALIDPAVAVVPGDPTRVRATSALDPGAARYGLTVYSYLPGACGGAACFPSWRLEATPAYLGHDAVVITTLPIARLVELGVWDARLDVRGTDPYADFYAERSAGDATLFAGILDLVPFPGEVAEDRSGRLDPAQIQAWRERIARRRGELPTR